MTIEPLHDEEFSIGQSDVTPRSDRNLKHDLWAIIGGSPEDAEQWIAKHGREAAEERIRSYWL